MRDDLGANTTHPSAEQNVLHKLLLRLFPFIRGFKYYSSSQLRADLIAGLTVALVLIPQSMAYAQLAGLPAYYGLYAALLPPVIAALFGSSHQLATGPVAVVSLMTSTALAPLATAGSEAYIAYAVLLALLVGLFQFFLGAFRLGLVVNFLSHPVVNGFTNATAIIIATSQLSKLFGVDVATAQHHYETIYNVIKAATINTHWLTFAFAAFSFAIMIVLRRLNRRIPNVLVAVILTTIISWAIQYERNTKVSINQIAAPELQLSIQVYNSTLDEIEKKTGERVAFRPEIRATEQVHGMQSVEVLDLKHQAAVLDLKISELKEEQELFASQLHSSRFEAARGSDGRLNFFPHGQVPSGLKGDGRKWRLKVGTQSLDEDALLFIGGGAVVGSIPRGIPRLTSPAVDVATVMDLLPMAVIISLLGFMEAISIAKAMAAKTGQRLDPNQELIGQGLANIVGSLNQSYPVSGSFSRSAVNLQSGAVSGLSSAFASMVVLITLLFLTPLLYYLPQAVLASIIIMAVVNLLNVRGFIHAWHAQKYDGAIAVITFVCTLAFAPHLDKGIMIGVALSLGYYLLRNIKPDIAALSKWQDGTYRDADKRSLEKCLYIAVIRFNNSLFFANVNYLEETILETIANRPQLRHILVVGNGINELDASGEEMLSQLVSRVREAGYDFSLSGLNDAVLDTIRRTHLYEKIGEDHIFGNVALAVKYLYPKTHQSSREERCPLLEAISVKEVRSQPNGEAGEAAERAAS